MRDWIARRFKAGSLAGTGLASTLLTLPMLAAAQSGRRVCQRGADRGRDRRRDHADGSAHLTMSNGTTVSVPAADVQIAANGDVLVSERVADIAAEVMAAGGGGAAIGGGAIAAGLGGAAALAAAAASGGGDGDGGGPSGPPTLNGGDFGGESQVLGVSGGFNSKNTGITVPEGTDTVAVTVTDGDGNEIAAVMRRSMPQTETGRSPRPMASRRATSR